MVVVEAKGLVVFGLVANVWLAARWLVRGLEQRAAGTELGAIHSTPGAHQPRGLHGLCIPSFLRAVLLALLHGLRFEVARVVFADDQYRVELAQDRLGVSRMDATHCVQTRQQGLQQR